jgi:hypothetical protein
MNRPLRVLHRRAFAALALLIPMLFALAIILREASQ